MKENINEHDMTKKMMDIMRGGFKKIMTENETNEYDRDYVIDVKPGTAEYNKQLQELQTVDVDVKIVDFKIYPNEQNVKLIGIYKGNNNAIDSGVHFTFNRNDEEPKITMQDVNLNSEFLTKLQQFFATWKEEWIRELESSYKPKQNG